MDTTTILSRSQEAVTALLNPPDVDPAPAPLRLADDPRYLALRAEIDAGQSVSGGTTEWSKVETLGRELLRGGALDLLVAAYTARALQNRHNLEGVAFGIGLFTELLGPRWDDVSPPPRRLRARIGALRWWVESAGEHLRNAQLPENSTPGELALDALITALDRLTEIARERFADETPGFGGIRRGLKRLQETIPPEPRGADAPQVPTNPPSVSVSTSSTDSNSNLSPSTTPENEADAAAPHVTPNDISQPVGPSTSPAIAPSGVHERDLRRLGDALIAAAEGLRTADFRDSRAYDILRHGLWLHLKAPPPASDRKTTIPPLDPGLKDRLNALSAASEWPEYVDLGERLLVRRRLDLNLQRQIAQALLAAEPPASAAASAVLRRTRELVERLPGLVDLCDRSGSPLADPTTRRWLAESAGARSQPPVTTAPAHSDRAPIVTTDTSGEENLFVDRLTLAEQAVTEGRPDRARPLFEGAELLVRRHRLERWRPDLAGRVLRGLLMTEAASDTDSPDSQRQERIAGWRRRLGQIDPQLLMALL